MFSSFKFQRNRWFWKFRHYVGLVFFYLGKLSFESREKTRESRESLGIFKQLVRAIIGSLFLALFIVFVLEVAERAILGSLGSAHLFFFQQLLKYSKTLQANLSELSATFDQLLTVIASVLGVFIGLYFTAVSVVAGSTFAKVPGDLRGLFLREKVGNVYIKILALATATSIILLGFKTLGGNPGILNSIFIIIFGSIGVLSFVVLGTRVFVFFDPTQLSGFIFSDLDRNIRLSTTKGFRWFDPSFQRVYQKRAASDTATFDTLVKVCVGEPQLERRGLSTISQQSLYFLRTYEGRRCFIPSDSLWYALAPRYKSWFLSDSSALSTALETQTAIQPEMVPDPYWLHDRVVNTVSSTFEAILKASIEAACNTLSAFNVYLESLGADLESKKAFDIINKIGSRVDDYFNDRPPLDIKDENKYLELALFDSYGLSVMSVALGFYKSIRNMSAQGIEKKIDNVDWLRDEGIYEKGFAPLVLPRMEFIQKRLKFEKAVEKRFLSPQWYLKQLVVMRYVELFKETTDILLSSLQDFFVSKSQSLLSKQSFILCASHSERGLEMCNKMRAHLPYLRKIVDDLKGLAVIEELPWPQWDWDLINSKIDKSCDRLVEILAKCIPDLSTVEQRESFPDLFGQAYSTVCQECYASMVERNLDKFGVIFPALFFGALAAYDRLRKDLADWKPETALIISSEPLVDILEISGYAKVYSELYDIPEFWNVCKKLWDEYLDSHKQPNEAVKFLVLSYEYRQSTLFQISPRDILRTNWRIRFLNELRDMDLVDEFGPAAPWLREPKVSHKSPVIRALCRGRYEPHISAAEIFIITYLLLRPEADGIEFEDRWGLSEAIKSEENNNDGEFNE